MVRLFEFTGPYHAPIIIEVFGRWVIQNADWWGAFGICSLVLDSMRLWVKAAPIPFPGARLISLLYSREKDVAGGSDVASEGCISENKIRSTSNCFHAATA